MRLDHYLSAAGLGSRSDVKKLISKGFVTVNGNVCTDSGFKINESEDSISCEGNLLSYKKFVYYMLNKPQGVISASKADMRNKEELCVVDLIKEEQHRNLFPVGRLDKDTEGLLLITDDGVLAHNLLSPKKHVDKTYYAELSLPVNADDILKLEEGIDIGDEKPTLPAKVVVLSDDSVYITIHEGRFHQIKRMFEALDNKVTYLKRVSMGSLELDNMLKPGEYRELKQDELAALLSLN